MRKATGITLISVTATLIRVTATLLRVTATLIRITATLVVALLNERTYRHNPNRVTTTLIRVTANPNQGYSNPSGSPTERENLQAQP